MFQKIKTGVKRFCRYIKKKINKIFNDFECMCNNILFKIMMCFVSGMMFVHFCINPFLGLPTVIVFFILLSIFTICNIRRCNRTNVI